MCSRLVASEVSVVWELVVVVVDCGRASERGLVVYVPPYGQTRGLDKMLNERRVFVSIKPCLRVCSRAVGVVGLGYSRW